MATDTGSTVMGTPAAAPAAAAPAAPAAAPAPAAWHAAIEDQTAVAWAKTRGYKLDDPAEAARHALIGHFNAEKLIGLDRAGRTVVLPKDDATPEEIAAFHTKLGRPAAADGYKLPDGLKDDPMAKAFLDVAHKAGYSQKQLDPVLEFVSQQGAAMQAQQEAAREAKAQGEVQSLKTEWGQEFELRSEAVRRARRELGLSEDDGFALENALGLKRCAELFFKIGKGLLEDKAEGLAGGTGATSFGLSATEAKARIEQLRSDREFGKKLVSGDTTAKGEWERLHQVAFG